MHVAYSHTYPSTFSYTFMSKVYQKLDGLTLGILRNESNQKFISKVYIAYSYTYPSNFWYTYISKVYQKLDGLTFSILSKYFESIPKVRREYICILHIHIHTRLDFSIVSCRKYTKSITV